MSEEFKLRSIPDKDNYATYLALPALELSRYSFGDAVFLQSYLTVNGQIAVLLKDPSKLPWEPEEHKQYLSSVVQSEGTLLVFKCPKWFELDMGYLLESKYSKLSVAALEHIENYSGMIIDFPDQNGILTTHRLVQVLRKEQYIRDKWVERLGCELTADMELEPPLREQDILYDIDTDISFIYPKEEGG